MFKKLRKIFIHWYSKPSVANKIGGLLILSSSVFLFLNIPINCNSHLKNKNDKILQMYISKHAQLIMLEEESHLLANSLKEEDAKKYQSLKYDIVMLLLSSKTLPNYKELTYRVAEADSLIRKYKITIQTGDSAYIDNKPDSIVINKDSASRPPDISQTKHTKKQGFKNDGAITFVIRPNNIDPEYSSLLISDLKKLILSRNINLSKNNGALFFTGDSVNYTDLKPDKILDAHDIVKMGIIDNYITCSTQGLPVNVYPKINFISGNMSWLKSSSGPVNEDCVTSGGDIKLVTSRRMLEDLLKKSEAFEAIYENIPRQFIFDFNYNKIVDIELLGNRKKQEYRYTIDSAAASNQPAALPELTPEDFRDFIVLDVFDEVDPHGKKVMDVIKQVLHFNKLDFAMEKVKEVPVNYFQVQPFGDTIIQRWLNQRPDLSASEYKKPVENGIMESLRNDYRKAPLTYLQALFEYYASLEPDIISSSFDMQSPDPFVLRALKPGNKTTNFVTAALNSYDSYADQYQDINEKKGRFFEPINSFLSKKDRFGVLLVGNQVAPGKFKSMQSRNGCMVDVLGNGTNWGAEAYSRYILKSDTGTSFATPEVATQLFIAKAVWRHSKIPVDAIEARTRLLLATNFDSSFVNKFSSAGTVNLEKLVAPGKGYFVSINDSITSVDSVISAKIFRYLDDGKPDYVYAFSRLPGEYNIRGMYFNNGRSYIFRKSVEGWKEVPMPAEITITVNYGVNEKTYKLDEFKAKFKQFVVF